MLVSQPSDAISPNHETDGDQNTLLMSKYTNRNNPKAKLSDRKDWNQQTSIRSDDTNRRAGKNPTWLSSPHSPGGYGPPTQKGNDEKTMETPLIISKQYSLGGHKDSNIRSMQCASPLGIKIPPSQREQLLLENMLKLPVIQRTNI